MNRQDDEDRPQSNEEAARLVQQEPALGAEPTALDDGDEGVDDDATTPDGAVSNQE
jgi:hypothetical protein